MNSFNGNGYQERQSVIQRNLNTRLNYVKSQADAFEKEEKSESNQPDNNQENLKAMKNLANNPLPQNHLKFPGNNQFRH